MTYFHILRSPILRPLPLRTLLVGSSLILTVACGGEAETSETSPGAMLPSSTGGSSTGGQPSLGETETPEPTVCNGEPGGDVDFTVEAQTPTAWEGKKVLVAAYQNDTLADGSSSHRRVLSAVGTIDAGTLSLSCPDSLGENYYYPSVGVLVDVDGDGKCSSADSGYQLQLYGWAVQVAVEISLQDWTAVGSLQQPLGSEASEFCAGYFADWQ